MIATIPRLDDSRSQPVLVARSSLQVVAEDGLAACATASEAVERAIAAATNGHVDLHLYELQRAAFELTELRPSLAALAGIAEAAPAA